MDINKILNYYEEYEFMTRFRQNELKDLDGEECQGNILENAIKIQKVINEKKENKLKEIIKKIKFNKEVNYKNQIIELVNLFESSLKDEEIYKKIKEIIKKEDYRFKENYELDIKNIKNLIQDKTIIICYPILIRHKSKIPFITFECKISEEKLKVLDYKMNIQVLTVILAFALECDINMVQQIVEENFMSFLEKIENIENQDDINEIMIIITQEIINDFGREGFKKLNDLKNYEGWNWRNSVFLTIESLNEITMPIFSDELKLLSKLIDCNHLPVTIEKYILKNNTQFPLSKLEDKIHFGSYTDEYPINEKQWKVISSASNNEFISVSGPPGTGKTTVLKENIANQIVLKAKKLIDCWEEEWEEVGKNKQKAFISPLKAMCSNSMIITSTNNKAVDNIGIELLKEIDYFKEIVKDIYIDEQKVNGMLCARLGKADNIENFVDRFLNPLIKYLESEFDEQEVYKNVNKFKNIWNELEDIKNKIEQFVKLRKKTIEKFNIKRINPFILDNI